MKNKHNTLKKYLFENAPKEYYKETVNGLFRTILEPIVSNTKFEACIFIRLKNLEGGKDSILKRLSFSKAKLFGFSAELVNSGFENFEKETLWDDTEFVIILGQRYSVALLWDFSFADKQNYANVCYLSNSKLISDIAKVVENNSKIDLKEFILNYSPDRRENLMLNQSINNLSDLLNDRNEEVLYALAENVSQIEVDEKYFVAEMVAEKAKFIAHEIKNNLSIINLYSKIIEKRVEKLQLEDEISSSISTAIKNINNASYCVSALINDLRCMSAPYNTIFNLRTFIENIVDLCREKVSSNGMNIVLNDIIDIHVKTDIIKLQSALTNIIFNAVEAGEKGCSISISVQKVDNIINIDILNDCSQITDDIKTKIFEPNFTTKEKGNGLGLAICKKQMELLGGSIELVNSTKKETLFRVSFLSK